MFPLYVFPCAEDQEVSSLFEEEVIRAAWETGQRSVTWSPRWMRLRPDVVGISVYGCFFFKWRRFDRYKYSGCRNVETEPVLNKSHTNECIFGSFASWRRLITLITCIKFWQLRSIYRGSFFIFFFHKYRFAWFVNRLNVGPDVERAGFSPMRDVYKSRRRLGYRFASVSERGFYLEINKKAAFRLNALKAQARLCSSSQGRWSERRDRRLCGPRPAAAAAAHSNSTRHIAIQTERDDFLSFFLRPWIPAWLPEGYTQHYEKDLSWHKSQSLHRWCEGGRRGGGGGDELFRQPDLKGSDVLLFYWWGETSSQQQAAPPLKAPLPHIHSFKKKKKSHKEAQFYPLSSPPPPPEDRGIISGEQQWNNSSLSKWQPSLRHSITDCRSITPHTVRRNDSHGSLIAEASQTREEVFLMA